ncbi:hypothetical protein [Streptomyces sp. NPDC014685]|uniref:hypothetical protein n=1 Tax=Streptomyces sp. NPDC014685 TaxID=3364881 RepID=UPI0036F9DDA9
MTRPDPAAAPVRAARGPVTADAFQETANPRTNTERAMNVPHPPGRPPVAAISPPRRSGRFRRTARALALAASLAVSFAAVTGCTASAEADAPRTPCGLVIDGSGSGAAGGRGFDAEAKLKSTLVPFLTDRDCGTLAFAPVTRSSQTSSCRVGDVDLDPPADETTDRDRLRRSARILAVRGALTMLECARTQGGSDVLGALARIGEAMPSGEETPSLLVVSDFEQADKEFTLRVSEIGTEESRERAVDTLLGARGVPGIAGMDVYPVGYGMRHDARPSEYRPFDAFWSEILSRRAKAHVHDDYRK